MDAHMTELLWVATTAMAVIAFAFIGLPLIKNNRRGSLVSVAVAVPVFAAGLYWILGSPGIPSHAASFSAAVGSQTASVAGSGGAKQVPSVASMIEGLAERLDKNPDDGKSWLLLAKSYKHLNRIPEAIDAYEKAAALGEVDAGLASLAPGSNVAVPSGPQISGSLRLAHELKAIVLPTDTVFIFARAVNGPRMPVAVVQRPASELPLDFVLNDSQAMAAGTRLSDHEQVIVTARISRSGVATEALQNLEVKSDAINVQDSDHLQLIINSNN